MFGMKCNDWRLLLRLEAPEERWRYSISNDLKADRRNQRKLYVIIDVTDQALYLLSDASQASTLIPLELRH